jgi:hypothetical protein
VVSGTSWWKGVTKERYFMVFRKQKETENEAARVQGLPFKSMSPGTYFLPSGSTFHSFYHLLIVHSIMNPPMDQSIG